MFKKQYMYINSHTHSLIQIRINDSLRKASAAIAVLSSLVCKLFSAAHCGVGVSIYTHSDHSPPPPPRV